jgi:hypothetical protein
MHFTCPTEPVCRLEFVDKDSFGLLTEVKSLKSRLVWRLVVFWLFCLYTLHNTSSAEKLDSG